MRATVAVLAVFILVGAGAACDPRLYHEATAAEDSPPAPAAGTPAADDDTPPPPPVSPFGALAALSKPPEPGPFDEPLRSPGYKDGTPYEAIFELSGRIVELDPPFTFSLDALSGGNAVALRLLIKRLQELDGKTDVAGILLRLGSVELPMSAAEELRSVLRGLKKPIRCHAESLGNAAMLVAAACGSLALEPAGEVAVTGPAVLPLYFKGLLDKLSLQADFVHIGAYKGAAEPLTRTEPSPEMRQTYDDLVGGAYARLVDALAEGRKAPRDKAVAWIDEGVFIAPAAARAGLIDKTATFTAFRDEGSPAAGVWKKVKLKEQKGGMEELFTMLGMRPRKRVKGPHVALIYAVGEVVEGRGSVSGAFGEIASGRLAPALRAAGADPDVKAIVLRVDSPGGSALASEVIWAAAHEAAGKKPLVVSMGSLAASGGYYISTPATRIFAQPDTLTGSIGVVGGKIVVGAGLARLGVRAEEIGRGKRALLYSPMRPWSDDERTTVKTLMEGVYGTFKSRVAEGRHLELDAVEKLAQGRVWTGALALERGLVDELGGLDQALAYARDKVGLPGDAPLDVYPGEPTLLELLGGLGGGVRVTALEAALATLAPGLDARVAGPLAGALRLLSAFEHDRIRLVAFLPVVR